MRAATTAAVIVVLAVLAGAAFYLVARRGGPAPGGPPGAGMPAVPVEVVRARTGTVRETLETVGTARADESVTVTAKEAGRVQAIRFEEGKTVEAGEILVELDADEERAELAEARAALTEARRAYTRARRLRADRIVSRAEVQDLASRLRAAEARVRAAAARLVDRRITAPFGGRVGLRLVSPGALVEPGTPITTLDDTNPIELQFAVPERELARLGPGLPVLARTPAYGSRTFEGRVSAVDTRVDPATRAFTVEADFPNGDGLLRPGMFLDVELVLEVREHAVLVPEEALVLQGDRSFVFTVGEGRAARREVRTGRRLEGWVEVEAGLEAGDAVIVQGLQKVGEGTPVQVLSAGQADPAS